MCRPPAPPPGARLLGSSLHTDPPLPRQQYNQEITDLKQPVLVSQPKRRRGPGGVLPGPAMLIPELCYLTGACAAPAPPLGRCWPSPPPPPVPPAHSRHQA